MRYDVTVRLFDGVAWFGVIEADSEAAARAAGLERYHQSPGRACGVNRPGYPKVTATPVEGGDISRHADPASWQR